MTTENREFDRIYDKYKNLVYRIGYRHSYDYHIAEDILQNTFLALYEDMINKNYTREEDYKNIVSWLYTTVKHNAINYKKKIKREVLWCNLNAEEDEDSAPIFEPARGSVEEEYFDELTELERAELHETIMEGLMEKNMRWYKAIMQVCILKVPGKEAAEKMGMRKDAFYMMLHRAREWVKETYGVEYKELMDL